MLESIAEGLVFEFHTKQLIVYLYKQEEQLEEHTVTIKIVETPHNFIFSQVLL